MADKPKLVTPTQYEVEKLGGIPVRTELKVLSPDNPGERKIGFMCYTLNGTDIYRPSPGVPWPPTSMDEVRAHAKDENLITAEDGLVEGEELLIQELFGLNIGVVHKAGMKPEILSKSGKTAFQVEFAHDRPEPAPPRWVCAGSINLAAIQRLNLSST